MAKKKKATKDPWADAVAHLRQVDSSWSEIIDRVGPCALRPHKDSFALLVRSIISQQISTKAAKSIEERLRTLTGEPHLPHVLLKHDETVLRSVGLSGVKARYILNLSEAVHSGSVPLHTFADLEDDAIIASLTSIKGIGVWTAEMFLIFGLNRPDVLPVADLGVRMGIRDKFGMTEVPKPNECRALAEPWRPYRTVASWYLWRSRDTAKQSPKP